MRLPKSNWKIRPYLQIIPGILYYQIVSALILGLAMDGIGYLGRILMVSAGHTALTSGDFVFVFSTWQGILLLLLALLVLCLYTTFDLNVKVWYGQLCLEGKTFRTRDVLKKACRSFKSFASVRGVFYILFVSLVVPIIGIGFAPALTRGLAIPNFIASVIWSTPLYAIPFAALLVFLAWTIVKFLFSYHAIVLTGRSVKDGMAHGKQMMRAHWRRFLPHILLFMAILWGAAMLVFLVCYVLPDFLVSMMSESAAGSRYFAVLLELTNGVLSVLLWQVTTPVLILEVGRYFDSYEGGTEVFLPLGKKSKRLGRIVRIAAIAAALFAASGVLTAGFDYFFPASASAGVIAHRTGGTLAFENSAAGIEAAAAAGAVGAETDVQRTKDGAYIINHDDTFERLYGVEKKPSEMTLAQIQALKTADGETVPTLEELLAKAKTCGVKLYIELKGETADTQMVDDVVKIVDDMGMQDQVALISLKYDVVSYAEKTYPDFETGYLYFFSIGDTTTLDVDDLIIEEQLADEGTILTMQAAGKKVIVWTVNEDYYIKRILASSADGIITDQVEKAMEVSRQMETRTYRERVADRIATWLPPEAD